VAHLKTKSTRSQSSLPQIELSPRGWRSFPSRRGYHEQAKVHAHLT
jgi:hypothetical protein